MDSKVTQKFKRENHYLNINNVYTIFKGTLMLITEVWKSSPYGSKRILRNYHYRSDPRICLGIVSTRRIPCSCHACTTILSLSWDSKTKEAFNQPRYGRVYNCKYSQIPGCHNNWIIMNYFDDGIYEENCKRNNQTIIDGNVMNMYLIIM